MVTIRDFDTYKLTDTTIVATDVPGDGSVKFSSTTWGTGADNVADTHAMTQEQLDKSVSVLMPALQSFGLKLEVAALPNGKSSNRFFQFAGITNGVCTPSTPSPTPAPTPPPTVPTTCGNTCSVNMAYKK